MEDVTGFNQKSPEFDGEKLVNQGVQRLRQRLSDSATFCEIVKMMLRFNENDRPSFCELSKHLQQSQNANMSQIQKEHQTFQKQQLEKKQVNEL
jgi:ketol-acid reductoisomerase